MAKVEGTETYVLGSVDPHGQLLWGDWLGGSSSWGLGAPLHQLRHLNPLLPGRWQRSQLGWLLPGSHRGSQLCSGLPLGGLGIDIGPLGGHIILTLCIRF